MRQRLIDAFNANPPRDPMSEDETMVLMSILMSRNPDYDIAIDKLDKESEIYKQYKPILDIWIVQVFLKRLEVLSTVRMSLGALLALTYRLNNAGSAVMYAFYIHNAFPENTVVDVNLFSSQLFPWGYFSEAQLKSIWDSQKVRSSDNDGVSDNIIDNSKVWIKD